jgi:hypothetical protein
MRKKILLGLSRFHHIGEIGKGPIQTSTRTFKPVQFLEKTFTLTPFLEMRYQHFFLKKTGNDCKGSLVERDHTFIIRQGDIQVRPQKILFHLLQRIKVSSFWDSSVWRTKHPETSGRISSGKRRVFLIFHPSVAHTLRIQ